MPDLTYIYKITKDLVSIDNEEKNCFKDLVPICCHTILAFSTILA